MDVKYKKIENQTEPEQDEDLLQSKDREFDELISTYQVICQDPKLSKSRQFQQALKVCEEQILILRSRKLSYVERLQSMISDLRIDTQDVQTDDENQINDKNTRSSLKYQFDLYQDQILQIDLLFGFKRSKVVDTQISRQYLESLLQIKEGIRFICDEDTISEKVLEQIFQSQYSKILIMIKTDKNYRYAIHQTSSIVRLISITHQTIHDLKSEMQFEDNNLLSSQIKTSDQQSLLIQVGLFKDVKIYKDLASKIHEAALGMCFENSGKANNLSDYEYLGGDQQFAIENIEVYQLY
ncbi:UNKNOWN [Stylonychia lemnae]|uniref:Uncharacterized protein n=1 Tax=Stylonychia lemnae TaxID=5949 RepID=A0A078B3S6_STYLE|nr:UNKNOWN [Stylonychia lemnae]|eukprot:CDW89134.1 UNKNOWN [Stylonychia lemnae]